MTLKQLDDKKKEGKAFILFFSKDTWKSCPATWEVVLSAAKKNEIEVIKIVGNNDEARNIRTRCFVQEVFPSVLVFNNKGTVFNIISGTRNVDYNKIFSEAKE